MIFFCGGGEKKERGKKERVVGRGAERGMCGMADEAKEASGRRKGITETTKQGAKGAGGKSSGRRGRNAAPSMARRSQRMGRFGAKVGRKDGDKYLS